MCACWAAPGLARSPNPSLESRSGVRQCLLSKIPILCERIGSLARLLPGYADVTWQNAATNFLERTLDDSANRRVVLPEALLCADEIVTLARTVIEGLRVDERRIATNLRAYAPFAGTQAVMLEAARAGGDRQRLHEILRRASMEAWAAVGRGEDNPLSRLLTEEPDLTALLDPAEIRRLLDAGAHVGTAPQRARLLADRIESLAPFPRQVEVALT